MLDSTIFPAGGGGKPRRLIYRRVITTSQVLTLPAGYYDIIAIGAGGSGGRATGSNSRATGGGGPAWARDWGKFDAPTAITLTIGARASGAINGTGYSAGNDGGTTTITGIANPITLTGGKAGNAGIGTEILGGLGGTATGGKIRANGSRGGNISTTATGLKVTGGGAVDLFCLGSDRTRGGDISTTYATNIISGGGGIGGRGGDITGTTTVSASSGGGAGSDATDNVTNSPGANINGVVSTTGTPPSDASVVDILLAYPTLAPTGGGVSTESAPYPGGGTGGGAAATPPSVPFGASCGNWNGTAGSKSGDVDRGGGSGGKASSNSCASGMGGQAFVVISVYAEVE